jgi:toxin YoeB
MEVELTAKADADLMYWQNKKNAKVLKRIRELLDVMIKTPFTGIGKPELLKYNLSGKWSRRIDRENRIVYQVLPDLIIVHSLKGHY